MSNGDKLSNDDPMTGANFALPYVFHIEGDSLASGLQADTAMAAMEMLRGTSGIHDIYQSSVFRLRRDGAAKQYTEQYQAGFALMVQAVGMGLATRGVSLPIAAEAETVARYEYVAQEWRALGLQNELQTMLCTHEMELLVALDTAAPVRRLASGVVLDQSAFWDGAGSAYLVLAQATADNNAGARGVPY
jgi:hypothetical protein